MLLLQQDPRLRVRRSLISAAVLQAQIHAYDVSGINDQRVSPSSSRSPEQEDATTRGGGYAGREG